MTSLPPITAMGRVGIKCWENICIDDIWKYHCRNLDEILCAFWLFMGILRQDIEYFGVQFSGHVFLNVPLNQTQADSCTTKDCRLSCTDILSGATSYRNWYQDWGHCGVTNDLRSSTQAEGCGELPRSLVTPQWPKSRYQVLFYHDASKHIKFMQCV